MPETKPTWVEALDKASAMLTTASEATAPDDRDSKTRLAYGYMDLAKLYKAD